jgi:hypothetical protein
LGRPAHKKLGLLSIDLVNTKLLSIYRWYLVTENQEYIENSIIATRIDVLVPLILKKVGTPNFQKSVTKKSRDFLVTLF